MFELLKKLVKEENERRKARTLEEITKGEENTVNYYLTDLRKKQLENGEITKEKAIELATKKAIKEYNKRLEKDIAKIDTVAESKEEVKEISISIEWKRSYMWGANPTAKVFTYENGTTYGTASGCGYDKESTAVAEALNQNNGILKAIYSVKEKALATNESISSHDAIHYGAGYGAIPYFEGGVGMGSLEGVLNKAGFILETQSHGKTYDYYLFKKK